jgi:RNA polymerase sigma factor (sigma-70 family)
MAMGAKPEAIEAVYRARCHGFRNALAAVTGSHDTARDAVQEGFAIALAKRSQFRGGSLEAWVWRISLSCAIDGRRTASRLVLNGVPDLQTMPPAPAATDPELAAAIASLGVQQRLIVFLRYYADLSYAQIAEACSVAEGTVAATLSQARAALLKELSLERDGTRS